MSKYSSINLLIMNCLLRVFSLIPEAKRLNCLPSTIFISKAYCLVDFPDSFNFTFTICPTENLWKLLNIKTRFSIKNDSSSSTAINWSFSYLLRYKQITTIKQNAIAITNLHQGLYKTLPWMLLNLNYCPKS